MYKEISLDPVCFKEFEYYTLLKNEFGHDAGRYIVAPVKEWTKEAFQCAKSSDSISPIKKKSVTNFLNKLSRGQSERLIVLPKDRAGIKYNDWNSWQQLQLEQIRPFCVNISEEIAGYVSSVDLGADNESWCVPPTIRVDRSASDIFDKLKPLCRFSKEVILIDQYFRLSDNSVLNKIFQFIDEDISSAIEQLTLVTSINTNDPAAVFANEMARRYTNKPSFRVIVAPEKFFHDRYVISQYGSLKTGQGFSEAPPIGAQSDRLSYNICGKEERQETITWLKKLIDERKFTADDQLN